MIGFLEMKIDESLNYLLSNSEFKQFNTTLCFDVNGLEVSEQLMDNICEYYPAARFDKRNQEVTFDAEECDWFSVNYNQLLSKLIKGNEIKQGIHFIGANKRIYDNVLFSNHIKNWLRLFEKLSQKVLHGDGELSFVLMPKDGTKSSVSIISIRPSYDESELSDYFDEISNPDNLLNLIEADDAHREERKSTLVATIGEIANNCEHDFIELTTKNEQLSAAFHANYEVYLRSFSFNEFSKELEDDIQDYTSKVSEQVHSFHLQALAVPGAVILASAVRSASASTEGNFAVFFSASIALTIVIFSLFNKIFFITEIANNAVHKLELYIQQAEKIGSEQVKENIQKRIQDFKQQVLRVKKRACSGIWFIMILLLIFTIVFVAHHFYWPFDFNLVVQSLSKYWCEAMSSSSQ